MSIAAAMVPGGNPAESLRMIRDVPAPFRGPAAEWIRGPVAIRVTGPSSLFRQAADPARGGIVVAADARIDNRDELAQQLGLDAPLLDDAAIVQAAWLAWGAACLDRLVGDFAIVVWNERERELFAARDPLGLRPLHFTRLGDGVGLASVAPMLVDLPGVRGIDPIRAAQRLAGVAAEPHRSYFEGVSRLPPGHMLRAAAGTVAVSRYWTWRPARLHYRRDDDYVEHFRALFDAAVRARLRSAPAVAALLSGGLDSAAMTAVAATHLAARGQRLTAVTWRPRAESMAATPGRRGDEVAAAARLAARYPNIDHAITEAPSGSALDEPDRLAALAGEPFVAMINALQWQPTARALAGQTPCVVLIGAHGNITISSSGLSRRDSARLALQRLRESLRWRFSSTLALAPAFRTAHLPAILRTSPSYWTDSFAIRVRFLEYSDFGARFSAIRALYGLDLSDPSADRRLVEFCLALPPNQLRRGSARRRLLRRGMRGIVPDEVLDDPVRGEQGSDWPRFIAPYQQDFRELLGRLDRSPLARDLINLPHVTRLVERWPSDWTSERHAEYLNVLLRAATLGTFILRFGTPAQRGSAER